MTKKTTANVLATAAVTALATACALVYHVLGSHALTSNLMTGDYPVGTGATTQALAALSVAAAVVAVALWVIAAVSRFTVFVGVVGLLSVIPVLLFAVAAFFACAIAFS